LHTCAVVVTGLLVAPSKMITTARLMMVIVAGSAKAMEAGSAAMIRV